MQTTCDKLIANYLHMRIAFVGKGGSGKTTISSLFIRVLVDQNIPTLAIDADLNQHLADGIGILERPKQDLGLSQKQIKEVLAGSSEHVQAQDMIKTTPPSTGSWIATSIQELPNKLPELFSQQSSLLLGTVGEQQEEDLGIRCYHSKSGAVELLLNHLVERENEVVVVDMVAGADAFASGLYDKFDLTVLVVEPTEKSAQVFDQYAGQAKRAGVAVRAVGNKITDDEDRAWLQERLGPALLGYVQQSSFVRSQERGERRDIRELEPGNKTTLLSIYAELQRQEKDWDRYLSRTQAIHKKNALSWGNASKGTPLEGQIDTSFRYPT